MCTICLFKYTFQSLTSVVFIVTSLLSSFEDTFCHLIVDEENNVTSIDNNDELSYLYCQSLPWASPRALARLC